MRQALTQIEKLSLGTGAEPLFHHLSREAAHNEALETLASSVGAAISWTTRFEQRQ